jgi:isopentenyldiphosphate isomerase
MKTIVVDEQDKYLTAKYASAITKNDIYRVAALWLTNSKDEILIAQRKLTKKNDPGKWGPAVSGTLEQGETYETNIYREAEEEIGLVGENFKLGPKIFNEDGFRYFVQWFTCALDWPLSKFIPQQSEVEKLAWVKRSILFDDIKKSPEKYIKTAYRFEELFS